MLLSPITTRLCNSLCLYTRAFEVTFSRTTYCLLRKSDYFRAKRSFSSGRSQSRNINGTSTALGPTNAEIEEINNSRITLLAKKADSISRKGIFENVKSVTYSSKLSSSEETPGSRPAIVLLGTPIFANWLQDNEFISKLLVNISGIPEGKSLPPFEVDLISACVDGLNPAFNTKQYPAFQGISILRGSSETLLPDLFIAEESTKQDDCLPASLTFAGNDGKDFNITVPLATTLFKNGRISTLIASRWQFDGSSFVQLKATEKRNQVINVYRGTDDMMLNAHISATPLTPARKIVDGLGNIVRSVEFDDGAGPASLELEASVDVHRKTHQKLSASSKGFSVWALIIPPNIMKNMPWKKFDGKPKHYFKHPVTGKEIISKKGEHILWWLSQGAVVARVLSGGGGWGAKQGLLSLDPQTTYHQRDSTDLEFLSPSFEEHQISALGNVAQPGSYIQFFASAKSDDTWRKFNYVATKPHTYWGNTSLRSAAFGTIRSTIDEDLSDDTSPSDTPVVPISGAFGCCSQTGLFTRRWQQNDDGTGRFVETKIDLPQSFLYVVTNWKPPIVA
ncbi:hypothetical protein BGZ60DRAFT_434418 [Tricladium varicosporioides]|nr:hypothetical protein BGZ60DRAFT_434418 [Hymenoscyphus varicosporioides]